MILHNNPIFNRDPILHSVAVAYSLKNELPIPLFQDIAENKLEGKQGMYSEEVLKDIYKAMYYVPSEKKFD